MVLGPILAILGNREHRRVQFTLEAAARLGWSPPHVLSWSDFLADPTTFDLWLDLLLSAQKSAGAPVVLRIESPGEDWSTERLLIAWGADEPAGETASCQRISSEKARELEQEVGRFRLMRQWYLGFCKALRVIARKLSERGGSNSTLMNSIDDIVLLFDKWKTHRALGPAGVAMAPVMDPVFTVDAMLAQMRSRDWTRVFVKPWHGSSASGVLALRWDTHSIAAKSTIEIVRNASEVRLYNSLKVRRYTDESDLRLMLDRVLADGAVVEQWLPKATYHGQNFDLRVVTIAQKAMHTVVRVGSSPMTNLHLGNARGDLAELEKRLGGERLQRMKSAAEQVASTLSRSHYMGVDVMITNDLRKVYVLEANAFGDLLPNVLVDGQDTYTAELAYWGTARK